MVSMVYFVHVVEKNVIFSKTMLRTLVSFLLSLVPSACPLVALQKVLSSSESHDRQKLLITKDKSLLLHPISAPKLFFYPSPNRKINFTYDTLRNHIIFSSSFPYKCQPVVAPYSHSCKFSC